MVNCFQTIKVIIIMITLKFTNGMLLLVKLIINKLKVNSLFIFKFVFFLVKK